VRFALVVGGSVVVALSASACGGPSAALREDKRALEQQLQSLEAKHMRARRTVRDLQNRIILLEEELDEQPSLNQPDLPVEVLGPESDPAANAYDEAYEPTAADTESVPGTEIVVEGSPAFEGDVEVVYEGEAARGRGRPSLSLDGKLARTASRRPTPAAPPPGPVATKLPATTRLPVVKSVPPLPADDRAPEAQPPPRRTVQARPTKRPPPRRRSAPPDPRTIYKRHYDALRAGDHARAIEGFRAFIADHPRHDYADNAQYWLGEAYYDQRQYKRALAEFELVATRFPKGNKVPDAMLKAAFCHEKLGDITRARRALARIVREHPKTNPAALAEDRLAALSE